MGNTGKFDDWDDYYRKNDVHTMPWFLGRLDHDMSDEINSRALKGGRFLDLGTGPGTQAKRLSSLGFDVTGSDVSQSAIGKAKKLYSGPRFVVDDILNSKFSDGEFDYIFDRGIFHVFERGQLPSYLSQIKRILKEDGLLFLKCMSMDEKNIPAGARPTLYSQEQVREFFQKDFGIETMKDSLFYGDASGSFKAIFTVLRNRGN